MKCQCDELRDKIRNMVITFRNDSNDAIAEIDRLTAQLDASRTLLAERDKLIENQQAEIESRNQLRYDALKGEHSRSPYYYDSWCKLHDHKGVVGTSDKPPIYYAVNLLNKLTEQNAALRAEIASLTALLAARDAEIDRLRLIEALYKAIINNTHIAEDERIEKIAQLTKQLTASQQEVERLKAEVQSLQCPSYCAREADARKQAAREIVEMLRADRWAESELRGIVDKFGLEG